jgi:hypothetical protein
VQEFAAANRRIKPISAIHFTRTIESKGRFVVNATENAGAQMTNDEGIPNGKIRSVGKIAAEPFDIRSSSLFCHSSFGFRDSDFSYCANWILWRNFLPVRGYGLRTDEPRQGRNAATVV